MVKKGYPPINITFKSFVKQLNKLFTKPFHILRDAEELNGYYGDYKECNYAMSLDYVLDKGYDSVEEWGNKFFRDWTIDEHDTELWIDHPELGRWIEVNRRRPELNKPILIAIPYEDNEVVVAMLDRDKDGTLNWVNLYTYEILYPFNEWKVFKWTICPDAPKEDDEDDRLILGPNLLKQIRKERNDNNQ